MRPFHKEVMREAEKIVSAVGGKCRFEDGRKKHARLIIEINGRSRFTPVSASPGRATKALHYKLGDIRRIVRELAQ